MKIFQIVKYICNNENIYIFMNTSAYIAIAAIMMIIMKIN